MIEPYPILEFRDGERVVPPHVAILLRPIETYRYTYEEAVHIAENQLVRTHLNRHQSRTTDRHFRENR